MNLLSKIRAWTYRRQLLEGGAATLTEVLQRTAGVYSSHPSAPLTLWARTSTFSPDKFRALEVNKTAVRTPAWRGSIFLIRPEDVRIAAAFREPVKMGASWYRSIGITEAELPLLREQVVAAATTPMVPKEFRAATGLQDQRVASIARHPAYDGDILRIGSTSLRSNALRYVSTASWLPELLEQMDPATAWRTIAKRYLAAYGPARIEDFRWWLGARYAQAAEAVARLETTEVGDGLLLLSEDVEAFEQTEPLAEDEVAILPKWDTYTMGFASDGRERLIDPAMQARGYTSVGDGLGLVLVAGKAVATWHHNFSGSKMRVELDIFDKAIHPVIDKVYTRFEEIALVLEGKTYEVTPTAEPLAVRLSVLRNRHARAKD